MFFAPVNIGRCSTMDHCTRSCLEQQLSDRPVIPNILREAVDTSNLHLVPTTHCNDLTILSPSGQHDRKAQQPTCTGDEQLASVCQPRSVSHPSCSAFCMMPLLISTSSGSRSKTASTSCHENSSRSFSR